MTKVTPSIQQFVDGVLGKSKIKIGAIVEHPEHGIVKIIDGQYWGEYGLSNHWTWREYKEDGTLGKEHSGYGWL